MASGLLAVGLALASAPASAQESGKAGMPQFDPTGFTPQMVWLAIAFVVLYLVMARVALPRISEILQDRAKRIDDDLDKTQALNKQSEAAREAYERAVAEARAKAGSVTAQAAERAAKEAAERQQALAATLAAQGRETEERIAAARAKALASTHVIAAEAAREAVRKLLGRDVGGAVAEAAVKSVTAKIS